MRGYLPGIIFTVISLLALGCEEPIIRTDRLDPAIRATFIDVDSLLSMEQSINTINDQLSAINARLQEIDELIESGDPNDYTEEIDSLESQKAALSTQRTEIGRQQTNVSQGNILIEQISSVEAVKELLYDVPRSIYRLPLNGRGSETELFILYNGAVHSVTFRYQTDTLLENHTVRIIAKNLEISSFDYDSSRLQCRNNECDSENASVIFYM